MKKLKRNRDYEIYIFSFPKHFKPFSSRRLKLILTSFCIVLILFASNTAFAQEIIGNITQFVEEKLGFLPSSNIGYTFSRETPNYNAYIGDKENNDSYKLLLEQEEYRLNLDLLTDQIGSSISKAELVEEETERVVKFSNLANNVDIVYRLIPEGIKQEIIIKENIKIDSFSFLIDFGDLSYEDIDGVSYFNDASGNSIFRVTKGWIQDGINMFSNDIATSIYDVNGDRELKISIPLDWLQSTDRVFPVILTQTIEVVNLQKQETSLLGVTSDAPIVTAGGSINALIGTSTSNYATAYSIQRKTFYDPGNSRYWEFYYDGTEIDIWYSADGNSWSSTTSLAYNTYEFSVWSAVASGTSYVWIAYKSGSNIYARRGTLGTSSITWDASSYNVLTAPRFFTYSNPQITRDSSGYLWIAANYVSSAYNSIRTLRSSNPNDPSAWGSITEPSIASDWPASPVIAALDIQTMYIVYSLSGSVHGCFWDNTAGRWEDSDGNDCTYGANTDSIGTTRVNINSYLSAVVDTSNYDFHLIYMVDDTTDKVAYKRWDNSTGTNGSWQSDTILDSSGNNHGYGTISIDTDTRDLYAFWMDTSTNHIFYRQCDVSAATSECSAVGDWIAEVDWKTTTSGIHLTSNFSGASKIFAEWTEGSSSPYNVYWDQLSFGGNSAPTAPSSLYTNESSTGAQSGASNPVAVGDSTPVFSAIYNDSDTGDVANKYEIIVYSDAGCSSSVWDSGESGTSMTNCTQGNRCSDINFGGSDLMLDGKQYYWKIRYWDDSGQAGAFSDCSANFTILSPGDQMRHGSHFFNQQFESVYSW